MNENTVLHILGGEESTKEGFGQRTSSLCLRLQRYSAANMNLLKVKTKCRVHFIDITEVTTEIQQMRAGPTPTDLGHQKISH